MTFALPRFFYKSVFLTAMLAGASLNAQAYSFECVSGAVTPSTDSVGCTHVGETLASWSLAGNVLTISNAASAGNGSFISGISFDTSLGQSVSLISPQMAGVLFTTGGGAHLPASLGWTIDSDFQANKKPSVNGVNAGESVSFLLGGVNLSNISNGSFKFGLHLQGLPEGRSEKLISAVPEASSYAMVMAGLLVVGAIVRRKS